MQLFPGDPAGEPADVDGDRDVDLLERPAEPDHVPPDQPHPRQERQRPHAHDRRQVLHTGATRLGRFQQRTLFSVLFIPCYISYLNIISQWCFCVIIIIHMQHGQRA